MNKPLRTAQPVVTAGALLGCGLGGLFDGVLLHQILQWHNMLSSVHPPVDLVAMKYNMLWDGLFHAVAWLVTSLGVAQLWSAVRKPEVRWSNSAFGGSLLLGWGLFNLVEGVIDHHWLAIHHVHPGANEAAWDIGFLVWGAAMLLSGLLLLRRAAAPIAAGSASYRLGLR